MLYIIKQTKFADSVIYQRKRLALKGGKNQALSFPCYSNEQRKECEIHPRTIVPHDKGCNTVYILAAPLRKAAPLP